MILIPSLPWRRPDRFFAQMNYATEALQDPNVRAAIAGAIDKEGFTQVLLEGNGSAANGPFPESFAFGDASVTAQPYDPEESRRLLAASGWTDTDGDGYVDKDGETLSIRWLTYPSRQELPLLAESVQASLKEIGIRVEVNCTANHLDFIESGEWDIYASAFVCAPTGDRNISLPLTAWMILPRTGADITATGWKNWKSR